MATQNDAFFLKEIALSALKGMCADGDFTYKIVFHSSNGDMENTKMLEIVVVDGKSYEFKIMKRRDPIEGERAPFVSCSDKRKDRLFLSYYEYVSKHYPILPINSTASRIFISHCGSDYEVTFVAKRDL